jgi:hypothetical protein
MWLWCDSDFEKRFDDVNSWDERFVGYGFDKVAHMYTLYVQQYDVFALPQVSWLLFLVVL